MMKRADHFSAFREVGLLLLILALLAIGRSLLPILCGLLLICGLLIGRGLLLGQVLIH